MMRTIFQAIFEMFYSCWNFFAQILESLNAYYWVLAAITFALSIRLLVLPVSGSRLSGSDMVKTFKRDKEK